jgi:hypothetical protein
VSHALRRAVLVTIGTLLVSGSPGSAPAHDGPHGRPAPGGRLDPAQSFLFAAISGAGGHFHELVVLPGLTRLLAGTHLGLFQSDDRGVHWRLAAARFSGVAIRAVVRDPRTGTLYVAGRGVGILVGRDGTTWRPLTPKLPAPEVFALALDPSKPHGLYAWFAGRGLFQTEDDGAHWERLSGPAALSGVQNLAVHPLDPRRLYAGTATGVWVSEDGGRRWTLPSGALTDLTGSVAIPPWAPELLLAATVNGVFTGTPSATGWTALPTAPAWWGPLVGFAFLPDEPGVIFAVAHEGVVAARRLSDGAWIPLAQFPTGDLTPDQRAQESRTGAERP